MPKRVDPALIAEVLKTEGLREARRRWSVATVKPVAIALGMEHRLDAVNQQWLSEWDSLLGTMGDGEVAAKTGVSIATVRIQRKKKGISLRRRGGGRWQRQLRKLSPEDFERLSNIEIAMRVGCSVATVASFRRAAAMDPARSNRFARCNEPNLRRAAVAGMLAAFGDQQGVQSAMARLLRCSRQRIEQLVNEVRVSLIAGEPVAAEEAA